MKCYRARRGLNPVPLAGVEVEPSNVGERKVRKFRKGDIRIRVAIK